MPPTVNIQYIQTYKTRKLTSDNRICCLGLLIKNSYYVTLGAKLSDFHKNGSSHAVPKHPYKNRKYSRCTFF